MNAARELLRQSGYDQFTVEGVAAGAETTRRSIYNRYSNREALYRASRSALLDDVVSRMPRSFNIQMPFELALEIFCAEIIDQLQRTAHREYVASMRRDARTHPWLIEDYVGRMVEPLALLVEHQMLVRAARGEIEISDISTHARDLITTILAATMLDEAISPSAQLSAAELSAIFVKRIS